MKLCLFWFIAMLLSVAGCSVTRWSELPVMSAPERINEEKQVILFELNNILRKDKLAPGVRVELLYKRANIYHSLGLTILAQADYLRILSIQPNTPEVYDHLGGYFADAGDAESAHTAYDYAQELSPTHSYTYLNRGLILYRSERYRQAYENFVSFYESKPEPIILLWIYLAEVEFDKLSAKSTLKQYYDKLDDKNIWGADLILFYLGKISEKILFDRSIKGVTDNSLLSERLTELYFYLGKYYLQYGNSQRADSLFKLAYANNATHYLEYNLALWEIEKLQGLQNNSNDE